LTCLDIRNSVEPEADGPGRSGFFRRINWRPATRRWRNILQNPNDAKYQRASEKAGAIRQREEKEKIEFAKRVLTPDTIWGSFGLGPLTLALMGRVRPGRWWPAFRPRRGPCGRTDLQASLRGLLHGFGMSEVRMAKSGGSSRPSSFT
jgi:hypothetical protein